MRTIIFLFLLCFATLSCHSQKPGLKSILYALEYKIIEGDANALKEIGKYLDDTTFVQEFLGYHNYPNTAGDIARRILKENTLFTKNEILFDSSANHEKFVKLTDSDKLFFDPISRAFLITPLQQREVKYELKELSGVDIKKLKDTPAGFPDWYYEAKIDDFLITNNPGVLLVIAAEWYKKKTRFNRYYFADNEFLDLIKKLTHTDLGVADEKGQITFLYNDDYYNIARLNYLIYWANHYQGYTWSKEKGYFINNVLVKNRSLEEQLFPYLMQENDSLALDAFAKLAELDNKNVAALSAQYKRRTPSVNSAIPTFPFDFLNQMTILTQYCRDHKIKYIADGWLRNSLQKLGENLEFKERYQLENSLVNKLTLDDITSVEYWGLVNENNWESTYSLGRVIDKFYSKNLEEIMDSEIEIKIFLKKSILFSRLGIIGICNKYLRKFSNTSPGAILKIKNIKANTDDTDIRTAANEIVEKSGQAAGFMSDPSHSETKNKVIKIKLKEKYDSIVKRVKEQDQKQWKLKQLYSEVSYNQLGEVIDLLLEGEIIDEYGQFRVIENDFGIDISSSDPKEVKDFLKIYRSRSEYDVYKYYFENTGIKCLDQSGNFLYDKVFEVLKFDVVDAFVGGGGSRRETSVYPLIRMLEIRHKTTLGFSEKFCDSKGVYSCNCSERAKVWLQFLGEKGFVKPIKSEPVSISFN